MVWMGAQIAAAATGALFVLLGSFVLARRHRTRAATLFGVYAIAFGASFVVVNTSAAFGEHWTNWPQGLLFGAAWAVLGTAAFLLAEHLTSRARGSRWPMAAVLLLLAARAARAAFAWFDQEFTVGEEFGLYTDAIWSRYFFGIASDVGSLLLDSAFLLAALRAVAAPHRVEAGAARVGIALAMYPAVNVVANLVIDAARGTMDVAAWLSGTLRMATLLVALACWIIWSERSGNRHGALAALLIGGPMVLGLFPLVDAEQILTGFGYAAAATRTAAILLIAYAILKDQVLGLDVRVKWTLQKSTIAAVFIAVFVGVQTFVSETFTDSNGVIWGAVAAAGLVFVFNPLQRAAERLSDKAMPGVKPLIQMDDSEKAYVYEQAARLAWKDGTIGRQERAMLDGMRDKLGLTTDAASSIESQAAG